ncbi:MAG TPA: putative Ig domain-containing protein, partial [Ruania sp.]|nr:putative Ig domain-containing protein [Ruania sp.]
MKPAGHHPFRTLATGAVAAALALPLALVAHPAPAAQASAADLITDHVVQIEETVSDAGFVHPGIGLSAEDLRTAQTQARAGVEPWASYFEAMTQVQPWANRDYDPDNMVDGQPDVVLTPNFDQGGLRGRMTRDAFGAMTQAVLWVVTGDEAYRRNAMWTLRTWSNMNPDGYAYFPDAHIHTGHPLYQFLLAAEIIRATAPVPDADPGEYDGYDTVWHPEDDEKLLDNLARPIMEVFNFSNERYMNQHNFGLFGRIATAIYADDAEGYQQGVEWLTVNAGYDGHDNGAIDPLFPVIAADDPANDYGKEFVQIQEMGRDQAHAECDVDNFTGLARMVGVQGTRVDPEQGTVSTAEDAVSVYAFGDNRILHGANSFAGFMLGAEVPWVDTTGEGVQLSQAYRGRLFNPLDELYLQYRYEADVDVAAEAPWIDELHRRWDGPLGWYGTGESNFWAPGDKNPEYWLALPAELAGTTPPAQAESAELRFAEHSLQLDQGTSLVTADGRTFARAQASPDGTTSVVSRMMYGSSAVGVLLRSDGPATLEVLPTATEEPYASVDVPDTDGRWRYVTYPPGGTNTHFYRVVGADGVTVDLDRVSLSAGDDLAPPQLEPVPERIYAAAGDELTVTLPLASEGEATFRAEGLPTGASIDPATGVITWQPSAADTGEHALQVVADDGTSLDSVRTTLVVTADREAMIEAAVADGTDPDA